MKRNFENLLSLLGPAAVKEDRGDISQTNAQCKSTSRPVVIQAGRGDIPPFSGPSNSSSKPATIQASQSDISHPSDPFRYAVQAADELLAELSSKGPTTARPSPASHDSISAHQSSSYTPRFDLSDLPITPYRVPPSYIEEMVDSLVIMAKRKKSLYNLLNRKWLIYNLINVYPYFIVIFVSIDCL